MSNKYREAGVDLEAGYESVRLINTHCNCIDTDCIMLITFER